MRRAALVLLPVVGLAALAGLTWVVLREPAVPAVPPLPPGEPGPDGTTPPDEEPLEPPEEPPPAEWTVGRFRAEIERVLGELPGDSGATPAELDAAAARAHAAWLARWDEDRQAPERAVAQAASKLATRRALRERWGELAPGPVTLRLRARGTGRTPPLAATEGDADDWFDPFAAPRAGDSFLAAVRGGAVPEGHALVVDQLEISATLQTGSAARGSVTLAPFPGAHFSAQVPRLRARFEGAHLVRPGDDMDVVLAVEDAAAEAVVTGRVVADADAPAAAPLRFVAEGSEGFLVGDVAVRVQVLAGTSLRTDVDLAGATAAERSTAPVWPDGDVTSDRRAAHVEGAGLVPPGHVLRVREVEWRVRFADEGRERVFEVMGGGETLVRRRGGHAEEDAGRWTGGVTVVPSKEWQFTVAARNGALGEALIRGRVEPAGD